jgi:hypothetical protein
MTEVLSNPWKPIPLFSIEKEKILKPITNDEVDPSRFKVEIEGSPNTIDKGVRVTYSISLAENDKYDDFIDLRTSTKRENEHEC